MVPFNISPQPGEDDMAGHYEDGGTLNQLDDCSLRDLNDVLGMTTLLWNVNIRFDQLYGYKDERILTGSAGEGTATTLNERVWVPLEDKDILVIKGHVTPQEIHPENVHSGFLNIKRGGAFIRKDAYDPPDEDEEEFLGDFGKLRIEFHGKPKKSVSGPAKKRVIQSMNGSLLTDDVPALECRKEWPREASQWQVRKRVSGWPSKVLIDAIIIRGFHVVPVSHSRSNNPHIEWRFSFSLAEKMLMLDLNKWQRNCFMLVKLLCKRAFRGYKLLSSYLTKTVFLWLLEEYGQEFFREDTIGAMSILLLDKMIHHFSKKSIPSYFIESNNLIDCLSREHVSTCVKVLRQVRRKPLYYLVDILREHIRFGHYSVFELIKTPAKGFGGKDKLDVYCMLLKLFATDMQARIKAHQYMIRPLTYRPLLEILCKINDLQFRKIGLQWVCPAILREEFIIDPAEYQHDIPATLPAIYCALGSHLRVKFLKCKDSEKRNMYDKIMTLFGGALRSDCDLFESMYAEYAAFLVDYGDFERARMVIRIARDQKYPPSRYKHFVSGKGHYTLDSNYFMLWLEMQMLLHGKGCTGLEAGALQVILSKYEVCLQHDKISLTQEVPPKKPLLNKLLKACYEKGEELNSKQLDKIMAFQKIISDNPEENARMLYFIMIELVFKAVERGSVSGQATSE